MFRQRFLLSLVLVVVCALAPTALAQDVQTVQEPMTLPLAVELALKTNPLTRAASAGRDMASAVKTEAQASRWPMLQVSQTFGASNNPVFVFGSLLEQARFTQNNFDLTKLNNPATLANFRSAINFKMPVFDQRQFKTRVARAQFGEKQADAQTTQIAQQIRFETLKSFYGLLLAEARLEVADEAVKLAEADVKRSRDRVDTGLSVVSDLLAAEVQLAEVTQQKIQAESDMVTARAALNTALGLPVATPQKISGALLEKEFALANADELVQKAIAQRPDLLKAQLQFRSSQEQVRGARAEALPRFDVYSSAGFSSQHFGNGSTDYLVGASLTFNLFDAGRKARLQQARAAEAIATSEQDQLANQIRFEVVRAQQQFIAARGRLAVASRIISHATEALRIVQDRYHEGLTTITEVLRAETALTQARLNVLAARHDHYVGYASLLLATGQLNDLQPFIG